MNVDVKKINSVIEQIMMVYAQGEIRSDNIPYRLNISISDVTGNKENTVMTLYWIDNNKMECQKVFTEDSFDQSVIQDNYITLIDHPFKHKVNLYLYDLKPHRIIYD